MSKIGSNARRGTLRGNWTPDMNILIAVGVAKAFMDNSCLWSRGGTPAMLKKAHDGLRVRIFAGLTHDNVHEYNDGWVDLPYPFVNVVVDGWDAARHGLIYTDDTFEKEINRILKENHIDGVVGYTEQGMQGDNFVSMSGDETFLNYLVVNYAKEFGFDQAKRDEILAEHERDIAKVVDELKSLKIGARRLASYSYGVDAECVYSKPFGVVTRTLVKNGWTVMWTSSAKSKDMRKGHVILSVRKGDRWRGPRISIHTDIL